MDPGYMNNDLAPYIIDKKEKRELIKKFKKSKANIMNRLLIFIKPMLERLQKVVDELPKKKLPAEFRKNLKIIEKDKKIYIGFLMMGPKIGIVFDCSDLIGEIYLNKSISAELNKWDFDARTELQDGFVFYRNYIEIPREFQLKK
jgi:hypothetical protein